MVVIHHLITLGRQIRAHPEHVDKVSLEHHDIHHKPC